MVESDLALVNIHLATAYHRAQNQQAWNTLVGTATSALDKTHNNDDNDKVSLQRKEGRSTRFTQFM